MVPIIAARMVFCSRSTSLRPHVLQVAGEAYHVDLLRFDAVHLGFEYRPPPSVEGA